MASDHLGSGIARAATRGFQSAALFVKVAETKIHNFQRLIVVDEQVLRLEVPVANAQLVNIGDARDELLEILAGHLLF